MIHRRLQSLLVCCVSRFFRRLLCVRVLKGGDTNVRGRLEGMPIERVKLDQERVIDGLGEVEDIDGSLTIIGISSCQVVLPRRLE